MKRVFIVRNGHQRRRRERFKAKLVLGSMQGIGFCGIVCAAQACSARPALALANDRCSTQGWVICQRQSYPPQFRYAEHGSLQEYVLKSSSAPITTCSALRSKPWHRCRLTWTQPTVQERRRARPSNSRRICETLAAWQLNVDTLVPEAEAPAPARTPLGASAHAPPRRRARTGAGTISVLEGIDEPAPSDAPTSPIGAAAAAARRVSDLILVFSRAPTRSVFSS